MGTSAVTYTDLNKEVPQVFLELWDVLVEAEQTLNEHFDLCTVHNTTLKPLQHQPLNTSQSERIRMIKSQGELSPGRPITGHA